MKKKMYSIRSYTKRETVLIRKLLSLLGETKESCIVISKKELVAIHEDYEKFLLQSGLAALFKGLPHLFFAVSLGGALVFCGGQPQ